MELQQQPICWHEQWKPICCPVRLQVSSEIRPPSQDADINRSIPSSPEQLRGGQLMLLPPKWAPCQRRQWQSDWCWQRRSLTVQKYCERCTLLLSYTALIQESSFCQHVTNWVNISSHYHLNLHLLCKKVVTNATPSSKVDALTAKLTLYYGDIGYTMPPAVLQQHYSVAIGYIFVLSLRKGGASGLAQPFCKLRSIWHWNEIGRPWWRKSSHLAVRLIQNVWLEHNSCTIILFILQILKQQSNANNQVNLS